MRVEYFTKGKNISEFRTYIPDEDQQMVERILRDKMEKYEEERRENVRSEK